MLKSESKTALILNNDFEQDIYVSPKFFDLVPEKQLIENKISESIDLMLNTKKTSVNILHELKEMFNQYKNL